MEKGPFGRGSDLLAEPPLGPVLGVWEHVRKRRSNGWPGIEK